MKFFERIRRYRNVPIGRKITFTYLSKFIAVLAIPLLMGIFYYFMTVSLLENDYESAVLALLEQSSQFCDQRFEEMDSIASQLVANTHVQSFKNSTTPFSYPNSYRVNETMNNLMNVENSNQFLMNYFVLFNNSKLVMNNRIAYSYEDFYSLYFSYENMDFDQWEDMINGARYSREILPAAPVLRMITGTESGYRSNTQKKEMVVTYIHPLISADPRIGYVMFIIDNQELTRMLSKIDIREGGFVFILDQKGTLISYITSSEDVTTEQIMSAAGGLADSLNGMEKMEINGQSMIMCQVVSPYNGYRYLSVQPTNVVHEKASFIQYSIIAYLSISLLVGFIVSIAMAHKNARPVAEIIRNINNSGEKETKEPFKMIKKAVEDLTFQNQSLQEAIDRQKPLLKVTLLGQLLRGEFNSEDEIIKSIPFANIQLEKGYFCVILFQCREKLLSLGETQSLEQNQSKVIIREVLESMFGSDALFCDMDEEKIALIMDTRLTDQMAASEYIQKNIDHLQEFLSGLNILISVGSLVKEPMDISRSYENAHSALYFHIVPNGEMVIHSNQSASGFETYYFPRDIRNRLASNIRSGNKENVHKLLRTLFDQNISQKNLPLTIQRMFLYDLLTCATQLFGYIAIDNTEYRSLLESLDKIDVMGDLSRINMIYKMYMQLCDTVQMRIEKQKSELMNNIESFIRQEYANPELSLTLVSEKFNINETYLSHIFKQHTNRNFSSYIETQRMEEASALLTNTNMLIQEIATSLGYSSTNSFCRAFKRFYNINASEYRKSHKD